MLYQDALKIAIEVRDALAPHCERIEIAGSIRREKPEVKDIEIVAIPKPYEIGLFESGCAQVVNQWEKVKGEMEYWGRPGQKPCRYTQRIHPSGIKIDIFFCTGSNWGSILAIRTGPADYSHHVLAGGWVKLGYKSKDGYLHYGPQKIPVREEIDLYNLLKIPYTEPKNRTI